MTRYLGDINTRARGLRTRLLRPQDLERLARVGSLTALQRELAALGFVRAEAPATPAVLEQAVRRRAASLMALLARWCNDQRRAVLSIVLEDEDRRSIQTILRGAAQGAASESRLSGVVPSADLPERALRLLAAQPTITDVVRTLVLWNHPLGRPLVAAVAGARPSLFGVEVELQRAFARRALSHAREGGHHLVAYTRQVVDVMNAWSALLHFVERDAAIVDLAFIEGGRWLDRDAFQKLLGLESRADIERALPRVFRSSPIAAAFTGEVGSLTSLETDVLRAQIAWHRGVALTDPSSAAPLLGFALELRAELLDLRRVIWGVALRAPAALVEGEMVAV